MDSTIGNLTTGTTPLSGSEYVEIEQGGNSRKVQASAIGGMATSITKDADLEFAWSQYTDDADGVDIFPLKGRGTESSPAAVQVGDRIFNIDQYGVNSSLMASVACGLRSQVTKVDANHVYAKHVFSGRNHTTESIEDLLELGDGASAFLKQVIVQQGSSSVPGIAFSGDPDTGFYATANTIYALCGGGNAANFSTTGLTIQAGKKIASGFAEFFAADPTHTPLKVRGAATQTASIQEWQDSSGSVIGAIMADGTLSIGGLNQYYEIKGHGSNRLLLSGQAGLIGAVGGSNPDGGRGISVRSTGFYAFSAVSTDAGNGGSGADVFLRRDAANALALRNSTAAQVFRAYNTYTDASNYERGVFDWQTTANVLTIGVQVAGSGVLRPVNIVGATVSLNGSLITDYAKGPASSVDGELALFSGTTGKLLKSTASIYTSGNLLVSSLGLGLGGSSKLVPANNVNFGSKPVNSMAVYSSGGVGLFTYYSGAYNQGLWCRTTDGALLIGEDASGYYLPRVRGTAGYVLTTDGVGGTSWAAAGGGGGGDVSKVGTPVDNQIGIWTGDGTIEGNAAFTFDGTTFKIEHTSGSQVRIAYDGTNYLDITATNGNCLVAGGGIMTIGPTTQERFIMGGGLITVGSVTLGDTTLDLRTWNTPLDIGTNGIIDGANGHTITTSSSGFSIYDQNNPTNYQYEFYSNHFKVLMPSGKDMRYDGEALTVTGNNGAQLRLEGDTYWGSVEVESGGAMTFELANVGQNFHFKDGMLVDGGLGLWGASVPSQQYNIEGTTTGFVAGSGTGMNDDSTSTGGVGTKAYTFGDVVACLKELGAMASS